MNITSIKLISASHYFFIVDETIGQQSEEIRYVSSQKEYIWQSSICFFLQVSIYMNKMAGSSGYFAR